MRNRALVLGLTLYGVAIGTVGCSSANDAQQTAKQETEAARERAKQAGDEISDAVKNAKPELNKAGEKVGQAARTVVDDAKAATRGVQEGWDNGQKKRVNLNTAKEKELVALPGIGPGDARRIIAARPYKDARETVLRGALTEAEYEEIQDRVTTR
jgi:DNA uptake protein ComE-like DNA-binding protein